MLDTKIFKLNELKRLTQVSRLAKYPRSRF